MSRPNGFKHSKETRLRISKSHMGIKPSKETRIKLSKVHKGYLTSEETKRKLSIAVTGKNNGNWKGGVTPLYKVIRMSREYKLWRIAVFERDNYTCIWCGAKNGNGKTVILNADHIKPFALFPELRFAIDNGRTLCHDCHETTDTYGRNINLI
jgi:5-methylcytosine-specific restriction endonuclease McrA